MFKEAEVDPAAALTYKREGSHILGFGIAVWWILANWDRVPTIVERVLSILPKLKGSRGFEDAKASRREAYAEDKIRSTLVGFHCTEFGRKGLVDLAMLLDRYSVEKIHFTLKLSRKFPNLDHVAEKTRFEAYTGIKVQSEICGECLILLLAALEQMKENGLASLPK